MHHHPPLEADRLAAVDHARRLEDARRRSHSTARRRAGSPAGPLSVRSLRSRVGLRRLFVAGVALACIGAIGIITADASVSNDAERPIGVVIGTPPMYE